MGTSKKHKRVLICLRVPRQGKTPWRLAPSPTSPALELAHLPRVPSKGEIPLLAPDQARTSLFFPQSSHTLHLLLDVPPMGSQGCHWLRHCRFIPPSADSRDLRGTTLSHFHHCLGLYGSLRRNRFVDPDATILSIRALCSKSSCSHPRSPSDLGAAAHRLRIHQGTSPPAPTRASGSGLSAAQTTYLDVDRLPLLKSGVLPLFGTSSGFS